jgi:hypothetical protein
VSKTHDKLKNEQQIGDLSDLHRYRADLDTHEVIPGTERVNTIPESADRTMYILLREDSDTGWKVAYRQILSPYLRARDWLEIPNCGNVPASYPVD